MTQRTATFALGGGLDLKSAALAVPPGSLVSALNYEPLAEGYGRVDGYERFDGRELPSETSFWTIAFDQGGVAFEPDDVIEGQTSGATATVLLDPHGFTGSWSLNTGAGTLVLADVTGTFQSGENLRVGGVVHARAAGVAVEDDAPDDDLDEDWTEAAQDWRRAQIQKVPGSGPVRGVAVLSDTVYAWRDNASATAAALWKATSAGWSAVTLPHTVAFTAGLVEILEGDEVNVGVTFATVKRVVKQSGNWGSTAAGYLVLEPGDALPAGTLQRASVNVATVSASTATTIPAGGKYDIIDHNFFAGAATQRLYGANGVGKGFEFDGTLFATITTGTADDKPTRVDQIANHLGFGFAGGTWALSVPGEPFLWDAEQGAVELGFGTEITDTLGATSSALIIFGQQKIAALTGRDSDTFQLEELTDEAGAEAWTAQKVGTTMYLDRRGLRSLAATQAFGNFSTGTLSELIEPYFKTKRKAGVSPICSYVSRTKSQYRLIWDDGTGLSVYMGRKKPEAIPFSLGDMQPYCATTAELADGSEAIFVGAEDGYVYRMDSGPSFDGGAIQGFAMLPFNHLGSIMLNKRFHKATLEMVSAPRSRIGLVAQFDYADGTKPIDGSRDFTVAGTGRDFIVEGGGGIWDVSTWNEFYWSAAFEGVAEAHIDGIGRNISLLIAAQSGVTEPAHILQAYSIHFSPRGLVR